MNVHVIRFTSETDIKEFAEKMVNAAGWDFAGWRFIPIEKLVIDREGRHIPLTFRQTQILEQLVRKFPHPVQPETIAAFTGIKSVESVKTQVHSLRRKLGDNVITSRGRSHGGYRFSGMVEGGRE